jgi:hypothetical protein
VEPPPGLDRRAHHDELGPALGGDTGDLLAEASRPRAHDLPSHADAVRGRNGGRGVEPLLQSVELAVELRVQGQLAIDDERRNEHDAGTAVGGEPAREVERVLRLLPLEQRDDDAAVGDRLGPQREPPRAAPERPNVRPPHRSSWYGTEARITLGSTSSNRFT